MTKSQLIEIIRISYLAGIDDKDSDCDQWCPQGSLERAQELFEEFTDDNIIAVEMITDS